jgi:hypothetical protein
MTGAVSRLQASEQGVWIFGDSDHSDAESALIEIGYEFLVLGEILYAPPEVVNPGRTPGLRFDDVRSALPDRRLRRYSS